MIREKEILEGILLDKMGFLGNLCMYTTRDFVHFENVAWVGSSRRSSEYLNLRPYVVPVLSS